jgi:hypothetical protein
MAAVRRSVYKWEKFAPVPVGLEAAARFSYHQPVAPGFNHPGTNPVLDLPAGNPQIEICIIVYIMCKYSV